MKKYFEKINEPYRSVLRKLLKYLFEVFNDKLISVVVFGSVSRGDYRKDSDVDLLVIVENLPKGRFRRVALFEKLRTSLKAFLENFSIKATTYHSHQ